MLLLATASLYGLPPRPRCQIDADFLEQSLDIASVKAPDVSPSLSVSSQRAELLHRRRVEVSSMDSEHAECAKALRVLAEKRRGVEACGKR